MAGFDFRYADDIVPNEARTRNIAGEIEEGRYLKSKVLLSLFKIECEHVKKLEIWEVVVVLTQQVVKYAWHGYSCKFTEMPMIFYDKKKKITQE